MTPLAIVTALFGLMKVSSGTPHDKVFRYGTATLAAGAALWALAGPSDLRWIALVAGLLHLAYFLAVAR